MIALSSGERYLDIDLHTATDLVRRGCPQELALKILLLTGKRTGELLLARWPEVDFEAATWRIPEANRKGKMHAAIGDELIPLSPPAVAAFKEALLELKPYIEASSPHLLV